MDLATRNLIIHIAILVLGAGIATLLVCRRANWKIVLLLAAAGIVSGLLTNFVRFDPIQRAILPLRFELEQAGGVQVYRAHDAPVLLAWLGRQGHLPPGCDWPNRLGPGRLPNPASYDSNFVCPLPGAPPPNPAAEPDLSGLVVYRGWRAFAYYAFGHHVANVLQAGGFRCLYHGIVCAIVLMLFRRARKGFGFADRAWVLVVSALLSVAWPALAQYSDTLFWAVRAAWFGDEIRFGADPLPLAVGIGGVSAIWFGAALAHIATIAWVVRLRLHRYSGLKESDRPSHGIGNRHRVWFRRGLVGAKLALLFCLFCAPVTLPLLGTITPVPIMNVIGSFWSQFRLSP